MREYNRCPAGASVVTGTVRMISPYVHNRSALAYKLRRIIVTCLCRDDSGLAI